jgi:hypothetical protein
MGIFLRILLQKISLLFFPLINTFQSIQRTGNHKNDSDPALIIYEMCHAYKMPSELKQVDNNEMIKKLYSILNRRW